MIVRKIEEQVREYARYADQHMEWADADAIMDGSHGRQADPEPRGQQGGVLTLDGLERPDESASRPGQRRRSRLLAAAAAAAALVVLVVAVVTNGNSDDVVTGPASTPTVDERTPLPEVIDPDLYSWSWVTNADIVQPSVERVFGGDGAQWMEGVTVGGPGLVAVGSDGTSAAVWTSVDGTTWERVAHDEAIFGSSEGTSMLSVTAGGPGLVAVGYEGQRYHVEGARAAVWTSVDGITWSRIPHEEAVFGGEWNAWMSSVTAGGPGLVAVGSDGISGAAVWTSVDGLVWSRVPQDTSVFGFPGGQGTGMTGVTVGGPGLVAVGMMLDVGDVHRLGVWTSVDGITWSRVPDAAEPNGLSETGHGWERQFWGVTAGGPGLVAVGVDGEDALVWTSVDGLTWSQVPQDDAVFGGHGELSMSMTSVTNTAQGLVAVGFEGRFGSETDEPATGSGPGGSPRQGAGMGPLSSARAVVWTSADGLTWSQVPHDETVFGEAGGRWTGITGVTDSGTDVVAVGADRSSKSVDATAWFADLPA